MFVWWFGGALCVAGEADAALRVDQSSERMRGTARFANEGRPLHAVARTANFGSFALATADAAILGPRFATTCFFARPKSGQAGRLGAQLAMPDARGALQTTEVWLHPGQSGRSRQSRRAQGPMERAEQRSDQSARPREPGEPGFVLEAFIPWSQIDGPRLGAGQGALRFEDVDAKSKRAGGTCEHERRGARRAAAACAGVGHNDSWAASEQSNLAVSSHASI